MRHWYLFPSAWLVNSRRTVIVLAISFSLLLVPVLLAQQPDVPENQRDQDVATPSGPPPADNVPPAPYPVVPPSLTIPSGTFVTVRLLGSLSSDNNLQGDGFSATLEQPIVVDGWVVARRGQIAIGRVVSVQKAGRVKGVSSMGVALSDLPLVDGRQLPVQSQLVQTSAGTSKGRDAVAVATTTGVGAAIGGAVDGGSGAGIGAAAGAAAGIAGVLLTPGRPTVMPPETLLTFRLQEPVTLSTERSQVAFQPVGQQDYASAPPQLQQRQVGPAYPGYPAGPGYPYAIWPYYGGWGFYPGISFVGSYGGYGWGRGGYYGGYGWGRGGYRGYHGGRPH
jgi:hypothetical protein